VRKRSTVNRIRSASGQFAPAAESPRKLFQKSHTIEHSGNAQSVATESLQSATMVFAFAQCLASAATC
jgi:hypothetical protein